MLSAIQYNYFPRKMYIQTYKQKTMDTLRIQNLYIYNLHKPKIPFVPMIRSIKISNKYVNFTRFLLSYTETVFGSGLPDVCCVVQLSN